MINNKTKFNVAKVTAIFELPNFFGLIFHFLALLLPFWAVLQTKNYNFAVQNLVRHGKYNFRANMLFCAKKLKTND